MERVIGMKRGGKEGRKCDEARKEKRREVKGGKKKVKDGKGEKNRKGWDERGTERAMKVYKHTHTCIYIHIHTCGEREIEEIAVERGV